MQNYTLSLDIQSNGKMMMKNNYETTKGLNVVSYFDGMSCGQIALERAGIPVKNYFAYEIDKYAIQVTQKNYPNTKQMGSVTEAKLHELPETDLLIGGSPCQGFSFAGKQLNFKDPQSILFFEFVKAKKILNPTYFLLENVVMKKEYQDIITNFLRVEPIKINSSLVSAQNRERLYWTNIENIKQQEDKGILLKDIVFDDALFCGRVVGRRIDENGRRQDYSDIQAVQRYELRTDGKFGALTTVQKDNMVLIKESYNKLMLSEKEIAYMNRQVKGGRTHWDFKHHSDINNEKASAVVANFFKGVPYNVLKANSCIRKFHPIECERLQTVPDNYTDCVSNTQRYKMLGNGWTVDVIAHIFNQLSKQ